MTSPRRVAGFIALPYRGQWRELTTGAGAEFLNGTPHFDTDFAAKRNAARRLAIRPPHTCQMGRYRIGQPGRNNTPGKLIGLAMVEGYAVGNAAGAAALTDIHAYEFSSRNRLLESATLHFATRPALQFTLPLPT